jgi:hypothetical protein
MLTPEILRTLKFRDIVRATGRDYTTATKRSDRFDLLMLIEMGPAPKYRITSKVITTLDGKVTCDLLDDELDRALEAFCHAYNAEAEKVAS